jgi:hypothetical protein
MTDNRFPPRSPAKMYELREIYGDQNGVYNGLTGSGSWVQKHDGEKGCTLGWPIASASFIAGAVDETNSAGMPVEETARASSVWEDSSTNLDGTSQYIPFPIPRRTFASFPLFATRGLSSVQILLRGNADLRWLGPQVHLSATYSFPQYDSTYALQRGEGDVYSATIPIPSRGHYYLCVTANIHAGGRRYGGEIISITVLPLYFARVHTEQLSIEMPAPTTPGNTPPTSTAFSTLYYSYFERGYTGPIYTTEQDLPVSTHITTRMARNDTFLTRAVTGLPAPGVVSGGSVGHCHGGDSSFVADTTNGRYPSPEVDHVLYCRAYGGAWVYSTWIGIADRYKPYSPYFAYQPETFCSGIAPQVTNDGLVATQPAILATMRLYIPQGVARVLKYRAIICNHDHATSTTIKCIAKTSFSTPDPSSHSNAQSSWSTSTASSASHGLVTVDGTLNPIAVDKVGYSRYFSFHFEQTTKNTSIGGKFSNVDLFSLLGLVIYTEEA